MILPFLSDDGNERFPSITHLFFDDHRTRADHHLQQRLKQHAPPMLNGGRAILWFCHWCQKPWYELGRMASFVRLSKSQLAQIAQQLGAEVCATSSFPMLICPLCAALQLGGMPRIEEYPNGLGYRFVWERIQSPNARFFYLLYASHNSSLQESLRKACSLPSDIPAASIEHVRSVLGWLKTLPDPREQEATPLPQSLYEHMNQIAPPKSGLSWCGYCWQAQSSPLGKVLVAPGMTFPTWSNCSSSLLVACWRQIAREMERMLAC